jgi:hypothetical protein
LGHRSEPIASTAMVVGIDEVTYALLAFFYFHDLAAFVIAAFRACAMGHFAFVAVRTFGKRMRAQVVVGAAGRRPLFRVSPFRICHF